VEILAGRRHLMKKVGIVICNYNKEDAVLDCIQSILESEFTDFDLYVVDNGSTDHSVQKIRENYPSELVLLENKENLGGSGGFNTGLRAVYEKGYPYVMCVDNDALLDEKAVGNLYEFLESHPEAGMAGAKVYHLEMPGYVQQFGQKVDFEHFCTEVYYYNEPEDGSMPEYLYVDAVAACSLMVRRTVIDKIGFMPEKNFLYWDDTEWCYRCNLAGYKVASVGNAKALHAMGAKKEIINTFPTYYAWRNWLVFFAKYTPESELERMAEVFLESIFQNIYEGLHSGSKNRAKTVMLAYDDAIHGVMGKAGENRIFEIDFEEGPFRNLFGGKEKVYLEENGYTATAERLKALAESMGYHIDWVTEAGEGVPVFSICESIFAIEDLSRKKVYIDISDCIFGTEEDALSIINYNYSRRSFVFAQKPVYLECIRKLRKGWDAEEKRMEAYSVKTLQKPVDITVEVPGSKSITNRALLMAAMGNGASELNGVLFSDDTRYFLQALSDLGFEIEAEEEKKRICIVGQGGKIPKKEAEIYVGSAGTAARFLTAFLAMGDGTYKVDSSEQMKKRPMRELLCALEGLGAKITYQNVPYHFPMTIQGIGAENPSKEQTAEVELNIDRSSQFLSALLMVAPLCFESLTVRLTGKRNARSYVEITEQMMKQFGHPGVEKEENCYQVKKAEYLAQKYQIEPDVSAACYFYAMAAVTGGSAMVYHMRKDSLQGDMKFLDVLGRMGCTLSWRPVKGREELWLTGPEGGRLRGISEVFSDFSDQALTMAAIAPFADAPVTIQGIAHIREQESDRIKVIHTELGRMGIECRETEDSITIYPGEVRGALVHTYDDHRAAMAFAITGLRAEGIQIENPFCCKKTFPEYFSVLEQIYT